MTTILLAICLATVAICASAVRHDQENAGVWTAGAVVFTILAVGFMFA